VAKVKQVRQALLNARTGEAIATDLELARSLWERTRGLLGRSGLEAGGGMRFESTNSIHMLFMRFAIDVLYLDRQGRAVKLVHSLAPWRFSASWRASATVELPAGTLRAHDVQLGDVIELRTAGAAR
jgi:uncharacterized membrane protein (UPF0127 family)